MDVHGVVQIATSTTTATPSQSAMNPYAAVDVEMSQPDFTRTLVVAKLTSHDISWIEDELHDILGAPSLATAVYTVDDSSTLLAVPMNKGHEAMVYLTYIIDHYHDLPDVAIFIHHHGRAWHNNDLLDVSTASIIRNLSSEKVVRDGYVNLRCHWEPGCPSWIHPKSTRLDSHKQEERVFKKAFQELFPGDPLPDVLSQPCCAQFAVSGQQIRRQPIEQYVAWRYWIMSTELDDAMSGRVFEYVWQYLFTSKPVYCPNPYICFCDAYSICFQDEHEYVVYTDIQDTFRAYRGELATAAGTRKQWLLRTTDDLASEMERRKQVAIKLGSDRKQKYKILKDAWDQLLEHPPGRLAEKYGHFGVDSAISPSR